MTAVVGSLPEGTITYNGLQFPTAHRTAIVARPEYSQDTRVVIGVRYEVRILFYLTDDTQTAMGASMLELQERLLVSGAQLEFDEKGLGLGIIQIGATGSNDHPEIMWGPKPTDLRMTPLGGNRAFECEWACQFVVSLCPKSGIQLIELNYQMSLGVDSRGLLTRQIDGLARFYIPAAYQKSSWSNKIDQERKKLIVPPFYKMGRMQHSMTLLPTHDGFTFSFTDKEIDGRALPPGIIEGSGRFSMSSQGAGMTQYTASVRCSLTEGPNEAYGTAAVAFFFILASWTQRLREIVNPGQPGIGPYRAAVLPLSIDWSTGLFDRTSDFDAQFTVNAGRITDLFGSSKMWEPMKNPLAGHNYDIWAASMAQYWKHGGYTEAFWAGEDAVYSMCDTTSIESQPIGNLEQLEPSQITANMGQFNCSDIDARASWIGFENRLIYNRYDHSTVHRKTQAVKKTLASVGGSAGGGGGSVPTNEVNNVFDQSYWAKTSESAAQLTLPSTWMVEDVEVVHGPPGQEILMVGRALRVQYKPVIPELVEVEGAKVEPVPGANTQIVLPRTVGNLLGCPVYMTQWAKRYRIKGNSTPKRQLVPLPDTTK